jgi:hypothetical protein
MAGIRRLIVSPLATHRSPLTTHSRDRAILKTGGAEIATWVGEIGAGRRFFEINRQVANNRWTRKSADA